LLLQIMQTQNSPTPTDFDFLIGNWDVSHCRLKERLAGCTEWVKFTGTSETRKVLGGSGNIEDNTLQLPEGTYRAVALRSFNSSKGEWAIWWLDSRSPWSLDTPVIGSFANGVGLFYANDTFSGRPIRVRFTWTASNPEAPRWEQAFSQDAGATWETNWTMDFSRSSNTD
jgi:hypothetical protein